MTVLAMVIGFVVYVVATEWRLARRQQKNEAALEDPLK